MRAYSFFRYPGGKSKLRSEIVGRLSKYASQDGLQYREPFFGGGSIGLHLLQSHPNISKVWVNDKDIGIACLWTSVIRHTEAFIAKVIEFQPSVEAFHSIKAELLSLKEMPKEDSEIVEVGFKKLAIHQISYSGLGTKSGGPLGGNKQKQYKIDGRWSPEYVCNKVKHLHECFRNKDIESGCCTNVDYSELITANHCDSLIYLDPPYYEQGNALYQHGFTQTDHERLAELLKTCKHPWVLSYDDCEEIRDLYSFADFHSLEVKYSIVAATKKPELLIYPRSVVDIMKPFIKEAVIKNTPAEPPKKELRIKRKKRRYAPKGR